MIARDPGLAQVDGIGDCVCTTPCMAWHGMQPCMATSDDAETSVLAFISQRLAVRIRYLSKL